MEVKKLLDLVLYGHVLTKPSERDWGLGYVAQMRHEENEKQGRSEDNKNEKSAEEKAREEDILLDVAELRRKVVLPKFKNLSHLPRKKMVGDCLYSAERYLSNSKEMFPSTRTSGDKFSYSDLHDYLSEVIGSTYAQSSAVSAMDPKTAKAGCFVDFENFDITAATDFSELRENFGKALAQMGFTGEISEIHIFGDVGKLTLCQKTQLTRQNIRLQHAKGAKKDIKDTADKAMLAHMMSWAFDHLQNFEEPANALVATSDVDFVCGIDKLKDKGFHVILGHNIEITKELLTSTRSTILWKSLRSFLPQHVRLFFGVTCFKESPTGRRRSC